MIRIFLGNVGSGKTLSIIKELVDQQQLQDFSRKSYSNIITKSKGKYALNGNVIISPEMIIKKEITKIDKNGKEHYKYSFNREFWHEQAQQGSFNVTIDEAHTLLSARSSMSKLNKIMGDFLALIRKITGESSVERGHLTLISQLERRIDIWAKEMATQLRYHVCSYVKTCNECGLNWYEHNEMPETVGTCPRCKCRSINKHSYCVIVWFFKNYEDYLKWKEHGMKTYYKIEKNNNMEKYFKYYNTFQIDNLLSDYIE